MESVFCVIYIEFFVLLTSNHVDLFCSENNEVNIDGLMSMLGSATLSKLTFPWASDPDFSVGKRVSCGVSK